MSDSISNLNACAFLANASFADRAKAVGSLAYGHGWNEGTSGGEGHIGIIGGQVVKFNTHKSERKALEGLGADNALYAQMKESCDALRRELANQLMNETGLDSDSREYQEVLNRLGITITDDNVSVNADAALLSRKDTAAVLKILVTAHQTKEKSDTENLIKTVWGGHKPSYDNSVAEFQKAVNVHNRKVLDDFNTLRTGFVEMLAVNPNMKYDDSFSRQLGKRLSEDFCGKMCDWVDKTCQFLKGLVPTSAKEKEAYGKISRAVSNGQEQLANLIKLWGKVEGMHEVWMEKEDELLKRGKGFGDREYSSTRAKFNPLYFASDVATLSQVVEKVNSGNRGGYSWAKPYKKITDSSKEVEPTNNVNDKLNSGISEFRERVIKEIQYQFRWMLYQLGTVKFSTGGMFPTLADPNGAVQEAELNDWLKTTKAPSEIKDVALDLRELAEVFHTTVGSFDDFDHTVAETARELRGNRGWVTRFKHSVNSQCEKFDEMAGRDVKQRKTKYETLAMIGTNECSEDQKKELNAILLGLHNLCKATVSINYENINPASYLNSGWKLKAELPEFSNLSSFKSELKQLLAMNGDARACIFGRDYVKPGNAGMENVPSKLFNVRTRLVDPNFNPNKEKDLVAGNEVSDKMIVNTSMKYFSRLHEVAIAFGVINAEGHFLV